MDTVVTRCWWKGACLAGPLIVALSLAAWGEPENEPPAGSEPAPADASSEPAAATPDTGSAQRLAVEQQRIADRFQRLEQVLLRMAELTAGADPQRAALLRKT
ncbi:MAG: hypothetical protein U1E05_02415, partial [Patescibacteria group bacterium]|nr:hypothetical protein [Patescibacteria group bacterium]